MIVSSITDVDHVIRNKVALISHVKRRKKTLPTLPTTDERERSRRFARIAHGSIAEDMNEKSEIKEESVEDRVEDSSIPFLVSPAGREWYHRERPILVSS